MQFPFLFIIRIFAHFTHQVAADIGEFDEAIRAHHRMIDLKDKHADADVSL